MFRHFLMLAVSLAFTSVVSAQESLKAEDLARIKSATVFIKVGTPRSGAVATGSGFLVKVEGETGYLVTNDHVVDLYDGADDEKKMTTPIEVVFESGTEKERSFKAKIVAADTIRDLATIKIENAKDLPKPLEIMDPPEARETMKVYVCGFPFGDRLSIGKKNPEISIGDGSVSSLRREVVPGPISEVQLNGALNPGNSGGPVVATNGKLIGVAVKSLIGRGVGIAVPQHEVISMLRGRPGQVTLIPAKPDEEPKGDIAAKLIVSVIDPYKNVKSVVAHILPANKEMPKPLTTPGPIPNALKVPLQVNDGRATADVSIPTGSTKGLIVQIEMDVAEGKLFTNATLVPVGPTRPGMLGGNRPSNPYGPQRTPDGNLKLASGAILPFPVVPAKFPTSSNSESVSLINAAPETYVGKSIRMDALSSCTVNPTDKNEYELMVETDTENVPSEVRVVLPKDLALQVADFGIPELITVAVTIKFPVRVVGKLSKPAGRERRYTLQADQLEFLNDDGKPVTTFKAELTAPSGKPTLSVVNRFPEKFVGQTLAVEAFVKGTRYAGGTGMELVTQNQAPPLNLEIYTSRSLAGQVESDIAKDELPARAKVTIEVKAIHGRTNKGVIGVKQVEVLGDADKTLKTLKTTANVEYPNIPTAVKAQPTPPEVPKAVPVDTAKPADKPASAAPAGDNTMVIVAIAGAAALVLGGGAVLLLAFRKTKDVDGEEIVQHEEPKPRKSSAVKKELPKPAAEPEARPSKNTGRAKNDDNPFANFS